MCKSVTILILGIYSVALFLTSFVLDMVISFFFLLPRPCKGRLVELLFRLSKNFISGMVPPPRIMVVKSTTTNVVVTKTFRVSSLNSNMYRNHDMFSRIFLIRILNFFANICQLKKFFSFEHE